MRGLSVWGWGRLVACSILVITNAFTNTSSLSAQQLVQYQFTGVVTDNSGNLGVFGPFNGVQLNDVFTGHFSYMTGPSNPDQDMGDPALGIYNVIEFDIDQAVSAITPFGVGVIHEAPVPTLPPLPADLGTDAFVVAGTFQFLQEQKAISLRLEAPYQAVFPDDSLPTSLVLSDFTTTKTVRSIRVIGLQGGQSQIDQGRLTSLTLVPEPTSAVLCMGTIGILLRPRRMRRRKAFFENHKPLGAIPRCASKTGR